MSLDSVTETAIPGHKEKKLLKDLVTPEHITTSEIGAHALKLYIGIVTGGEPNLPKGSEVITDADLPGLYSGTLTITATLS